METIKIDECELKYNPMVVFDRHNPNWSPTPEYCVLFLRASQNYLNDLYKVHGYLFLNEVYQQLGVPVTGAGQVLGWIFGESEDVLLDWTPRKDGSFEILINPLGVIFDQIDEL